MAPHAARKLEQPPPNPITPISEIRSTKPARGPHLLTCRSLEVGYARQAILPAIDVDIGRAEFWAVIGRNGAGKTTWFRTLLGLVPAVSGRVERQAGCRISYIPQRNSLDPIFPLLARDVVAMGVERRFSFLQLRLREPKIVMDSLALVEAKELADAPFYALSEGQKQRVLMARLAASQANVAFLDEPTAAMDAVAERAAFELLEQLRVEQQMTVVVVSHHLGVAREFADRALFVDRESSSVANGTPDEIVAHPAFQRRYPGVVPVGVQP